MKLVALNIRHGGGARSSRIGDYLIAQDADVVILSEFRTGGACRGLTTRLTALGYAVAHPDAGPAVNTVAVFSRCGLEMIAGPPVSPDLLRHLVAVRVRGRVILAVYFPQREAKRLLFEALQSWAPGADYLIGDFNTGRHLLDEVGTTFHCADAFEALLRCGYHDAWRERNPDEKTYSWQSGRGRGFRIDHALVAGCCLSGIRAVYYDETSNDDEITDHSAVHVIDDDWPDEALRVSETPGEDDRDLRWHRENGRIRLQRRTVEWPHPHTPAWGWTDVQVYPEGVAPPAIQRASDERVALADSRYFLRCCKCTGVYIRGSMIAQLAVCHGCATMHLGIIF
jgi:exodeoxyribonuclease-3